jgi:hypothetical protein
MQGMAIQPLDLLPPVDVTFKDYALSVLRAEELSNPADPDDYRGKMIEVFVKRGILDEAEGTNLRKPHHVFERLNLAVFLDVDTLASSSADAYRFLDDNRSSLFIFSFSSNWPLPSRSSTYFQEIRNSLSPSGR